VVDVEKRPQAFVEFAGDFGKGKSPLGSYIETSTADERARLCTCAFTAARFRAVDA
jgi:hypothetical protein